MVLIKPLACDSGVKKNVQVTYLISSNNISSQKSLTQASKKI